MRPVMLLTAVVLVGSGLSGCAKVLSAQDLVGSWKGKVGMADADIVKLLKQTGKTEKDLPDAKKQLAAAPEVPFELKKDMSYSFAEGQGSFQGSWTYLEGKLTLTILTANGQKVEDMLKGVPADQAQKLKDQLKPLVYDVDKEGKTISGDLPGLLPGLKVTFTRPAAK